MIYRSLLRIGIFVAAMLTAEKMQSKWAFLLGWALASAVYTFIPVSRKLYSQTKETR